MKPDLSCDTGAGKAKARSVMAGLVRQAIRTAWRLSCAGLILASLAVHAAEQAPAKADGVGLPPVQHPDSLAYPPGSNAGNERDLQWPAPAKTVENPDLTGGSALSYPKPTTEELIQNVAHNKVSINLVWTLIAGFLVMFMQAGFALVETGLCRGKSAAHVMTMNFMIYGRGVLGFWVCGFGIMFGGYAQGPVPIGWQPSLGQGLRLLNHEWTVNLLGHPMGLMGHTGVFSEPCGVRHRHLQSFLFQVVFMDTAATIPTGAMAERWNFSNFMIYGLWVGALPYAFFGNWVWGGGWLAQLGQNFGLGHGHVDFAGSSVVHMCGGTIALAQRVRPRPAPGQVHPGWQAAADARPQSRFCDFGNVYSGVRMVRI